MANNPQTPVGPATQAEVGHESGHANFPPFDPSTFPSQLLWLAISFGTLYYYMSKRFLPGVGAVIEARKARIPWEEPGDLPVERMAREALDTPQCVPLHPAAERFWRSRGYL